ncbi:toll/interleukin-1 receptor domain-containing protein [Methanococcoides seepicolus]|uniref:Toll/interleukin-1 receptor domain-containing protein n=1 Tax=Methanococcoides seepicolus TaxID=2828780 RepID=A0A9E4ZIX3_9EURY|nr:toll/interleukin-1 receptor domain-containing protein [Methanococcoides seepicolus]MCM1987484.1 toll/interleukin-1 receptor domain-containing protein [Methanococcoides seepicolus]
MSDEKVNFKLSTNIEKYLTILSKVYAHKNQDLLHTIIINSQIEVDEGSSYDNLDGGIYGHRLHMFLPESLYLDSIENKEGLQNQIVKDINQHHSVKNEFIEEVHFEMEVLSDHDWRTDSGVLLSRPQSVSQKDESRIWGEEKRYKVFLSHKSEDKIKAAKLKDELEIFGISAFVAHEDIHPIHIWQDEIENALFSMDTLVALMTKGFHDSDWTDQEIGVAFGLKIPIIPLRFGKDPYGFIGKFQGLTCDWSCAAKEIVQILFKNNQMLDAYINAVKNCPNYDNASKLSTMLPIIDHLSDQQVINLISAFNENTQINDSYRFKNLVSHLNRIMDKRYEYTDSKQIREI